MSDIIPLAAQIAEVKREIALRKNVFPKWIAQGRMTQAKADHQIAAMTAALHTLTEYAEILAREDEGQLERK